VDYTPFINLTDEELVLHVCNKKDATPLEVELMTRLQMLLEHIDSLMAEQEVEDADARRTSKKPG